MSEACHLGNGLPRDCQDVIGLLDRGDPEGELRVRLPHIHDLRRFIPNDPQGNDPVQELVVS